jgi:hypothetical protein
MITTENLPEMRGTIRFALDIGGQQGSAGLGRIVYVHLAGVNAFQRSGTHGLALCQTLER